MQTVIAPRGCYLVALAREVEEGEHVEVDDDTAHSLIEQGWESLRSVSARKAAARKARQSDEPDESEPPTDLPADAPVTEE
jgi:hypothetical protein